MSLAEELQPLGLQLDWIEPLTIFGHPNMSIRPVLGELGVIVTCTKHLMCVISCSQQKTFPLQL